MAASTKDMSAQLAQHAPVRLLIAEKSENAAYQFDSLLRDAGIATRLEIIELPMAVEKLPQADMMLCNAALPQLEQLLPRLTSIAPQVPVIVVNNDQASISQSEGMELGAADVVSDTESRHLVLVVKRELENVCRNIQMKALKKALNESEQRCQLLLQSSRAAIAYVHEGMHIHANEGYLKLFGFEDSDDLLGLPLIDLLDADSGDTLKAQLKQFRQEEQEADFDFVGISSDGSAVKGNMTLANAEYEGEHCLQVTVRVAATKHAVSSDQPVAESGSEPNLAAVPVLRQDAVIETEEVPAELGNGTVNTEVSDAVDQTAKGAVPVNDDCSADFELTLEGDDAELVESDEQDYAAALSEADMPALDNDATPIDDHPQNIEPALQDDIDAEDNSNPVVHAAAESNGSMPPAISELESGLESGLELEDPELIAEISDVEKTDTIASAEDPSTVADVPATAAVQGTRALTMPEFLAASEGLLKKSGDQFVSVFVAHIDGYEELQRTFGLSGVDDVCQQVETHLLTKVNGPFMEISPYQWATLVCSPTREEALEQVEVYRATVEAMMFEVREKTVRPTCTFGGAIFNADGFDRASDALEATVDKAFTTLRSTLEESDGNSVALPAFENADQEFDDAANRVLSLISEAIENHSFTLLFQPIISLRGDSDEHYEVFLRMSDRNGQQMAPGEFLRTAIDNGVAGKIDRWVILQSIKMLSAHRANGHNTRLTINLTSNSVADPEFIQWLGVAIKAARLPSDAVIFQITERDAGTYVRQTREFVEGLKQLHCRSSLSRFGLQAETFEVLDHIPVDFVKLDGALIEALDKNPEKKEQVTEMVQELQNTGKLTIVPMVESAALLSTLWQAGVNYIQGHYLQEPSTSMDYDFSTDD